MATLKISKTPPPGVTPPDATPPEPVTDVTQSPNYDPEAQASIDNTRRIARGATATIVADVAGMLPGLAGLAGSAGGALADTARAAVDPDKDMQFATDMSKRMVESDALESSLNLRQWAYDLFETESYKRDVRAGQGEEGYIPLDEEMVGTVVGAMLPTPGGKGRLLAKAPGAVRWPARVMEWMLPGTPMGAGRAGVAANVATGVGVTEATRAVLDEPTVTGSIYEMATSGDEAVAAGIEASGLPISTASGTFTVSNTPPPVDEPVDEEGGTDNLPAKAVGAGVGTAAAIGVGLAALRRGAGMDNMIGRGLRAAGEAIEGAESGVADAVKPLVDEVRKVAGDTAARKLESTLKRNIYTGGGNMIHQAEFLGDFGDNVSRGGVDDAVHVRTRVPLRVFEQAIAALDAPTRDLAMRALDAVGRLQELDAIKMTPEQYAMYSSAYRRLEGVYNDARKNPRARAILEANKEMYRGYQGYRFYSGMIDNDQVARENGRRQYQPAQRDLDEYRSFAEKVGDATMDMFTNRPGEGSTGGSIFERTKLRERAAPDREIVRILNEKRLDAVEAARLYSKVTIAEGLENQARRDFIDAVKDHDPNIRRARENESSNVITVMRNGQAERWVVKDNRLFNALKFRPHFVIPSANFFRKTAQAGMTGALNPVFAPTSLLYSAAAGVLMGNNRHGYTGLIDQVLDDAMLKLGVSDNTRLRTRQALAGATRIPDAGIAVLEGMYEGLRGRWVEEVAHHARKKLGTDPTNIVLQARLTEAVEKLNDTIYGQMIGNGYQGSRFEADPYSMAETNRVLRNIGTKLRDNTAYRTYHGALNTVREAYQVGIYARNIAALKEQNGGKLRPQDYQRAVAQAKDISVDTAVTGSNPIATGLMSAVPYSNVSMRTFVHMVRSMGDPATASVLLTTMAFAASQIERIREEAGEEALDEWARTTPEWDQMAGFPMLIGDEIVTVPLGIELGAITWASLDYLREAFNDQTQGERLMAESPQGNISAIISRLLGISTPPVVNLASIVVNGQRIDIRRSVTGDMALQRELRTTTEQERYYEGDDGVMTDRMAGTLETVFGGFGAAVADAIEIGFDQTERVKYDGEWFKSVQSIFENADLGKAAQRFTERAVTEQAERYTKLWGAPRETATFTPQSQRVYEVSNAMERIKDEYMKHVHGGVGRSSNHYSLGKMLHELASTPALLPPGDPIREQLMILGTHFNARNRIIADLKVSKLRSDIEGIDASPNIPRDERIALRNNLNEQLQDAYETLMLNFGAMEEKMRERYGPDWTLQGMVSEVNRKLGSQLSQ